MSSPLGIATRGGWPPTGLSVATRGLIVELQGLTVGGVASLSSDQATDVALVLEEQLFGADLEVADGQLLADHGLLTSVVISLFTDRLAEADDVLPGGGDDRRGWWGDLVPPVEGDLIGSRLWLLSREKQTQETRLRAEEYAREALEWLVEDGVASALEIESEWIQRGVLGVAVRIHRPTDPDALVRFAVTWEGV